MDEREFNKQNVTEYVESQARGETVERLERMTVERVFGRRYEVWDVQTDQHRWWVVTGLTNLYSQEKFPSMDEILSLHIGLMERVASRQFTNASEEEQAALPKAFRKLEQAGLALEKAEEAEDCQTVGVRCRETLISLVRSIADDGQIAPEAGQAPKKADAVGWAKLAADALCPGEPGRHIRRHLRGCFEDTWRLAVWLQHNSSATRFDAEMALDAVGHVFSMYALAYNRSRAGDPESCPECGSYQVVCQWRSDFPEGTPYLWACGACEWEAVSGVTLEEARGDAGSIDATEPRDERDPGGG